MSKKLVGIDCDEVLVQSGGVHWWNWLTEMANNKQPFSFDDIKTDYDYGQHFKDHLPHGVCPYDFFRTHDLYCCDSVQPIEGSVEGIQRIRDAGHDIVVVSYVMGEHFGSKFRFLQRNFNVNEYEFVATKNKGILSSIDAMIDDRHQYLSQFNREKTQRILFETSFESERTDIDLLMPDWSENSVTNLLDLLAE